MVVADDNLTFGRTGDLVLDADNRFLHRHAGEFTFEGGAWGLHNRGSRGVLRLFASDGVHVVLPPGGQTKLGAATGTISCQGGPASYELTYLLLGAPDSVPLSTPILGEATAMFGVPLTPRETDFMLAFATPVLTGSGTPIPTYAEVALAFGVRPKTVDTTLQRLRKKLTDAGAIDIGTTAGLVTHLLATGKLTYSQLIAES